MSTPRRWNPRWDPLWPVLLGVPAVAFWGVLSFYRSAPVLPFPRQETDFRPPDVLTADEAAARGALEKDPEDLTALVELARAYFERGPDRYVAALENLERARDLGALDDRLNYYAGVMYDAKGLGEYAAPEFERFLRRHPDDRETRLHLANLYYRMDELDKAIAAFRRVLAATPADPLVSFNLSLALRDRQRYQEGLDLLLPFVEHGPALPPGGLMVVGDLYRGLKDPVKALDFYHREQSRNGESPALLSAMALALEAQARDADALALWEKLAAMDDKNREARDKARRLKRRLLSTRR